LGGYGKIILVIAENAKKKKGVKIETQKQSYEVSVYRERERLMCKLSLDPPTASHTIIVMLFLFVLILC
jgi:hypothetical protein